MVQGLVFFGHGPVRSLAFTCRSIAMDDASLDFDIPGRELAVAAEALYLANLMIVPGVGFVALLVLWLAWYLYSAFTGVHSVTVKNDQPVISPLLPPPPPPPPPPK